MNRHPWSPRTATGPRVVVVGNLTIDDVVLADGTTLMATLGGNSVHTAAAATACGATSRWSPAEVEDFPADAFERLAARGRRHDVRRRCARADGAELGDLRARRPPALGLPHPGRAVRRGGSAAGGRRAGAWRTLVSSMSLRCRWPTPRTSCVRYAGWRPRRWSRSTPTRAGLTRPRRGCSPWPRAVDLFEPSLEELQALTGEGTPAGGLRALTRAGVRRAVVKAGADGAYVLTGGGIVHVPALETTAVDTTGAGDSFCGGVAAGLARAGERWPPWGWEWRQPAPRSPPRGVYGCLDQDTEVLLELGRDLRSGRPGPDTPLPPVDTMAGKTQDGLSYDIDVMRREIDDDPRRRLRRARRRRRTCPSPRPHPRRPRGRPPLADRLWRQRLRRPGGRRWRSSATPGRPASRCTRSTWPATCLAACRRPARWSACRSRARSAAPPRPRSRPDASDIRSSG